MFFEQKPLTWRGAFPRDKSLQSLEKSPRVTLLTHSNLHPQIPA